MTANKKIECTEAMICDCLHANYTGNSKYRLNNAYIFKEDWESDFFVQKENGYCYEFEVKISRSDFFNDKKKVNKHLILGTGKYQHESTRYNSNATSREDRWISEFTEKEYTKRPNKFYYVVPDGMISKEEVPSYAGLMYFRNGGLRTIKEAPFIHKEKIQFESTLCKKFYVYWLNEKFNARMVKRELEYYKNRVEELTNKTSCSS